MHDFHYKDDILFCEDVPLGKMAQAVGTPLYVYSSKTLTDHFQKLDRAFSSVEHLICYSVKSNSNLAVLSLLKNLGSGFDIVSGGELFRALKAGADPRKIVFAGVGKTADEIEFALKENILFFTVESFPELEEIDAVARRLGKTAQIAIRVNPDVDPKTHQYTSTGKAENKFGLDMEASVEAYRKALTLKGMRATALHMHIGSQIVDTEPYQEAVKKIIPLIQRLKKVGVPLETLDIGGGLGIVYKEETPSTAEAFARAVLPLIRDLGLKILIEPGRFVAGNAGVLLTKVLYLKTSPVKNFVIVDAGMNDLIRPSLYGAYHGILPVVNHRIGKVVSDVVGPICESGDFFAKDRSLPSVEPGDILAIMSAGAYGFSMASHYNSRPRVAEVMVRGNQFQVIREREKLEDLIRGEKVGEV
ncbi:MAG: diaminopimelate decarboxylase [Chlamydiae bacterium]|nr:diaminopimelate decarboxylase [Chlamydiota bacterium]MBI3265798.1 diaminopimelate decarboxylase [Chlamydiota bacterium]